MLCSWDDDAADARGKSLEGRSKVLKSSQDAHSIASRNRPNGPHEVESMPMQNHLPKPMCVPALAAFLSALVVLAAGQTPAPPAPSCDACAEWNRPQKPFRIYGNTY